MRILRQDVSSQPPAQPAAALAEERADRARGVFNASTAQQRAQVEAGGEQPPVTAAVGTREVAVLAR